MAKIKHIAIKVEDQEQAADFYKKTFGMTEAWRGPVRDDGYRAIYLTDGYINNSILDELKKNGFIDKLYKQ